MTCPKCNAPSGDDWSQCEGVCPMPGSPHYRQPTSNDANFDLQVAINSLTSWLLDNTDGVFEEVPEIDGARQVIIDFMERQNAAKA